MSEAKLDGFYTINSPAILLFPNVIDPKPYMKNGKPQGDPKYSGSLVFDATHPDLQPMKDLVIKKATDRWPGKPLTELAFPFSTGDKQAEKRAAKGKNDADNLRGKVILKSSSKYEPRLVVLVDGKMIDVDNDALKALHKNKFYNGVEVLAQINFVTYDPIGENAKGGVTAYLNMILSFNKGKRLSGGATASEVFKGYVGGISSDDPTGGENLNDVMGF